MYSTCAVLFSLSPWLIFHTYCSTVHQSHFFLQIARASGRSVSNCVLTRATVWYSTYQHLWNYREIKKHIRDDFSIIPNGMDFSFFQAIFSIIPNRMDFSFFQTIFAIKQINPHEIPKFSTTKKIRNPKVSKLKTKSEIPNSR